MSPHQYLDMVLYSGAKAVPYTELAKPAIKENLVNLQEVSI